MESKHNTKDSHQITKEEKKKKGKKKTYKNKPKTMIKMAIRTYISIITLNGNGINAPTKRHRVTEWIQNKTGMYAVCRRLTLDLETHTD